VALTLRTQLVAVALAVVVGACAGCASALFLWLLDLATHARLERPSLVFALPLAGLAMGFAIVKSGAPLARGTDAILAVVAFGGARVPLRLAPLVLLGTVLTHLFGGSAGREGTAVQMGGALADEVAQRARVDEDVRRLVVRAGIAAGFGSVFGTPLAGALFALEIVGESHERRTIAWRAVLPVVVAALVGDRVTLAFGIAHTAFPQVAPLDVTPRVVVSLALVGLACALVTHAFLSAKHGVARALARLALPPRMAVGGAVVVALALLFDGHAFLGLGVETIVRAFEEPLPPSTFAFKGLFTAITLGAGFLGGEVTPLFFMGATLGNTLAPVVELPLALAAGACMVAVYGAAARAPLALAVMGAEVLGIVALPHLLVVTVVASLAMGPRSLFAARATRAPSSS